MDKLYKKKKNLEKEKQILKKEHLQTEKAKLELEKEKTELLLKKIQLKEDNNLEYDGREPRLRERERRLNKDFSLSSI
ncbi:MAG: hypothetical protein ACFFDN_00380 [Candidatus Hodarchaeota archaeon]